MVNLNKTMSLGFTHMPSGKGEIMSTTIGVVFDNCKLGPVGKLVLPAPHRTGNIKVDVIVNINNVTFRSIDRSIDLRCIGICEYRDYAGHNVTIRHDRNEWNDLEITITIED